VPAGAAGHLLPQRPDLLRGRDPVTDVGACPASRGCYAINNLEGITCVTASDCYAVGAAGTIEALHEG
jgi:hypothetical protein